MDLSSFYDIRPTVYGGRGCFASVDISQGTPIHEVAQPLSLTVLRSFKKEVCLWCFHYDYGRSMKFKIENLPHFYFCGQNCIENFERWDKSHVYRNNVVNIENWYTKVQKKSRPEPKTDIVISPEVFHQEKERTIYWEAKLPKKATKLLNELPSIDENELMELKYVLGILYEKYLNAECQQVNLTVFEELQDDTLLKLTKYPYLLDSYKRVYQFLRIVVLDELLPFLSVEMFWDSIGKNLSNAFGIWTLDEGEKEFLGYSLYPTASFFNHSCASNLDRKRVGQAVTFFTKRDVKIGEELCISYGNSEEEDTLVRQKELSEWNFICQCTKCQS